MTHALNPPHRDAPPLLARSQAARIARRAGLTLALAFGAMVGAHAAPLPPEPPALASVPSQHDAARSQAQRASIEARMGRLDAAYAQDKLMCARRFFVNACLDQARTAYLTARQALQAELHAVDLAVRERRAEAERRRVAQNLRERQVPDAAAIRQARAAREQELATRQREHAARLAAAADHEAAVARQPVQRPARPTTPPPADSAAGPPRKTSGQEAQQSARARASYARKLADYKRRQQEAAEQNKAGEAPALPIPRQY